MTVIADKDRQTVRDLLARELVHDVELLFFTRPRSGLAGPGRPDCLTCDETRELLEQLADLSDRLHLTIHDLAADRDAATRYNVSAVPTVLLRRAEAAHAGAVGSSDGDPATTIQAASADDRVAGAEGQLARAAGAAPNVRFLGEPAGYEFSTLVADIVDVSKGRTGLAPATLDAVRAVDRPVHIQVFVTPT
jgi:alkyl hydroperoxide reductase subunit AhpF